MRITRNRLRYPLCGSLLAAMVALPGSASAAAPITFTDMSPDPSSGIAYRRAPSSSWGVMDAIKLLPFVSLPEMNSMPIKGRGAPGVAVWDYDNDGDLDIFVTNGPGRAHSLYQNQLVETGQLTFIDVGVAAGLGAVDMDGTGVCYGDIDNDGDHDLLVLGRMEPNRLFRNNGDGTFTDITASANVGGGARSHTSCSMGDIDGDGLLDIFVANTFDWSRYEAIFTDSFDLNHTNDLYRNQGGNVFGDVSETSGIRNLFRVPPGDGTITWGVSLVDYDQDGDIDIIHADDQGAMPSSFFAGVDRGFLQVFNNDGSGNFTNVTGSSGSVANVAAWMGVSFGDFNCDGNMDVFATSQGDYLFGAVGAPAPPGIESSRWHLGGPGGTFTDSAIVGFGVQGLGATPFGWGTGAADYDNDGDTDIIYFGNLPVNVFSSADNPGVVLRNDGCSAQFSWDKEATSSSAATVLRQDIEGFALGDLNNDGFVDMAYASGQYVPTTIPLIPMPSRWGSPFDETAFFIPQFMPIGPQEYEWSGVQAEEDGFLGVQISSASTGNKWVKIGVKGSKGLTAAGKVNRDGIGAIVKFMPQNGKRVTSPVLGGSSYESQHSLIQGFGLGAATSGTVDILWPGGVWNRLEGVAASEHLTLPEIPCSYAASWPSQKAYMNCVGPALGQLAASGAITPAMATRLGKSAAKAYGTPSP